MDEIGSNPEFVKDYNEIFKESPLAANIYLLICEMADNNGQVTMSDDELTAAVNARFIDPDAYQLGNPSSGCQ